MLCYYERSGGGAAGYMVELQLSSLSIAEVMYAIAKRVSLS